MFWAKENFVDKLLQKICRFIFWRNNLHKELFLNLDWNIHFFENISLTQQEWFMCQGVNRSCVCNTSLFAHTWTGRPRGFCSCHGGLWSFQTAGTLLQFANTYVLSNVSCYVKFSFPKGWPRHWLKFTFPLLFRAACVRCHGTKSPLLTAFFLFSSPPLLSPQKEFS